MLVLKHYQNTSYWKNQQRDTFPALTLQSLEGMVLLEFLFMKLSIQCWNFFLNKESSSQLHSEYGRPIHLHRYSGSLEDVFLWPWAVFRADKTEILTDADNDNNTNINTETYKGSQRILMPFLSLLLKNNASNLVGNQL